MRTKVVDGKVIAADSINNRDFCRHTMTMINYNDGWWLYGKRKLL